MEERTGTLRLVSDRGNEPDETEQRWQESQRPFTVQVCLSAHIMPNAK